MEKTEKNQLHLVSKHSLSIAASIIESNPPEKSTATGALPFTSKSQGTACRSKPWNFKKNKKEFELQPTKYRCKFL